MGKGKEKNGRKRNEGGKESGKKTRKNVKGRKGKQRIRRALDSLEITHFNFRTLAAMSTNSSVTTEKSVCSFFINTSKVRNRKSAMTTEVQ